MFGSIRFQAAWDKFCEESWTMPIFVIHDNNVCQNYEKPRLHKERKEMVDRQIRELQKILEMLDR